MIPKLSPQHSLEALYLDYLTKLEVSAFSGEIHTSYASRLAVATDNSVYQYLPQAVVFPKSTADIKQLCRLASASAFESIKLTPRGGGTGTNGQSLTQGIVVDLSKFMNKVIELNVEERWVRVETGIVKDKLNSVLKEHGLFFSPELSTSNRATLGGMINTDASGQGSMVYGKTSDHVLSVKAVLASGEELDTEAVSVDHIDQQRESLIDIYSAVKHACVDKRSLVEEKFPKLNRFLTGYDLKNAYSSEDDSLDLTRILCGSEGSLAFISEAKLDLTAIPKFRTLVTVKYDSFNSALRHAPSLVAAQALSVETIDSKVLNLAQQDVVWDSVRELISDVEDADMQGINIVEFAENDELLQQQKVSELLSTLSQANVADLGVIGYQSCDDLTSINAIYNMRKKAVGLLGNTAGAAKPVAFAEDTCVPPENLADYIVEFRKLLDDKGLQYGMFGHVDSGVLHVRPALDLCDPEQELLMREVSDQVVSLTAKYKGLMWGEHGKGFRSEYSPAFFGDELFAELRKIKAAFDPHNQINPGKICTPLHSEEKLVSVDGTKRGKYDREIAVEVRDSYKNAMECNGNGLCFNYDTSSPMCPSFKATGDRRYSPKGRAGLMREWLRQLAALKVDPLAQEQKLTSSFISPDSILLKIRNSIAKSKGEYDYSHEVYDAMQTCLACKACTTGCPIKVDVPTFRSRFLNIYHGRYLRPIKDYFVAYVETYAPLMAKAPRLFNAAMAPKWTSSLVTKTIGMVDIPTLSFPTLAQRVPESLTSKYDFKALQALSDEQKQRTVLIVQDPFTTFYEAELVEDFIHLAKKLGINPVLLPFKPNGKPQHIKGFLSKFNKSAQTSAAFLNQVSELGIKMVGVEPALVLCYRDEYKHALGEKRGDFEVQVVQEWLDGLAPELFEKQQVSDTNTWYLFGHCTEKALKADAFKQWQQVFTRFGASLEDVAVGCCGMAGTYGHDAKQLATSKAIYELSWKQKMASLPRERCMVTGYSCRSQVKRLEGDKPKHPLQILLSLLP
ncbi:MULTISPECIES: D-2-hydroxyglutarate dehydrogenase YdiJ [unclassified Agarivorans]|uniref:D-2-hydroxyglutarate dehydrogenase YdiJ n=2 Tax=Pseudomonadota TaxID=1224 RepID=UPI0026E2FE51|nr:MULTISPECIES: FAD-binding and (Fe-S)-binding domain-containing protein [unclassified Agarivorans]MDO6687816.1 FAD-binding and (Fe-S)-binding domain-containing protein [Agarivorans sp. 3_MG-2023]MDO6717320.1 FAD-binding and (Fe-S)-binding domain-containing protein [Agarivorans sp. 2_MG-2023]